MILYLILLYIMAITCDVILIWYKNNSFIDFNKFLCRFYTNFFTLKITYFWYLCLLYICYFQCITRNFTHTCILEEVRIQIPFEYIRNFAINNWTQLPKFQVSTIWEWRHTLRAHFQTALRRCFWLRQTCISKFGDTRLD